MGGLAGGFGPLARPLCPRAGPVFACAALVSLSVGWRAGRRQRWEQGCVRLTGWMHAAGLSPPHSFRGGDTGCPQGGGVASSPPPCRDPASPKGCALLDHQACAGPGRGRAESGHPCLAAPGLHHVSPLRPSGGGKRPAHFHFLSTLNI